MSIPTHAPRLIPRAAPGPCARLLSNGHLTTLVTADGTGFTNCAWQRVTSWTPDAVEDHEGMFIYLRDETDGRLWSAALEPAGGIPDRYDVSSEPGMVRIVRVEHGIEAVCEVVVAAEVHADLRRLRLRNIGNRPRRLTVTTWVGLVLHHPGAHAGHPGFSKLFVQTSVDTPTGVLLARRRPRGPAPEPLHIAHVLLGPGPVSWETDRARFVGRGRSLARPAALEPGAALSGTVGNVLDPIASERRGVELAPGACVELYCVLAAAPSAEEARANALRFGAPDAFDEARVAAERRARDELGRHGLTPAQGEYLQALLGGMLYGVAALRASAEVLRRVRGTAEDLWVIGIAPDRPLVVVENAAENGNLVAALVTAASYWAALGVSVQMLAIGGDQSSTTTRARAAEASAGGGGADPIVVPKPGTDPRILDVARACARLVLSDAWPDLTPHPGPQVQQVQRAQEIRATHLTADAGDGSGGADAGGGSSGPEHPAALVPASNVEPTYASEGAGITEGRSLRFDNGVGGFAPDGREYVIHVPGEWRAGGGPPMPWVNVIANARFGTLVSERGAAVTWSRNSRAHRLTPWANDPILDPHGEALWVRDDDAGEFWSPQPGPTPGGAPYEVRHGFGYSTWRHRSHDLDHEVTTLVAADDPVKLTRLRLTNRGGAPRRVSVFAYARLVLGVLPEDGAHTITVEPGDRGTLYARTGLAGPFADGVAFGAVASDAPGARIAFTADRRSFLGVGGTPAAPRALADNVALDGVTGTGLDPCFAHQLSFELAAGATVTCVVLLGEGVGTAQAKTLVAQYRRPDATARVLDVARTHWERTLGAVQVTTPSPAVDLMLNGWLAYQTLSCRLWGRTAFYQSGGAFGYRDQLQDAAALIHARPDLTRAQILLHAAHQFVEGDVLHWWHPPIDRGTRTRFADDLLWLPYVTAHYVAVTGERDVLDERVDFVTARLLEPGEDEAHLATAPAGDAADVYDHCCRAIDRSLRVGTHGLPLMGTGDWNDGMNLVGREGRGESVWMAFFLFDVLRAFEPLCHARGDDVRARHYAEHRTALAAAIDAHAWDGAWYRRAYFDDGTPLGTAAAAECRIDVLPQAWAVISGAAPRARAEAAMDAIERELVMPEGGLIRLLAPPFDRMPHAPGYIKGYVPGIRENGGQYTHAALWAVRATAELGRRDRALALLEMLTPVLHTRTPEEVAVYQAEPYAVAADVYAVAPHVGRGGWTWYTGSSGWMLRVALESVLGLHVEEGQRLILRPCVPDTWPEYRIDYRLPDSATRYTITVRNPTCCAARVTGVELDGAALVPIDGAAVVPIARDGATHDVLVTLGRGP